MKSYHQSKGTHQVTPEFISFGNNLAIRDFHWGTSSFAALNSLRTMTFWKRVSSGISNSPVPLRSLAGWLSWLESGANKNITPLIKSADTGKRWKQSQSMAVTWQRLQRGRRSRTGKNCEARCGNRSVRRGRKPESSAKNAHTIQHKLAQDLPFGKVWPRLKASSHYLLPSHRYQGHTVFSLIHPSVHKYLNGCLVPARSDTKYDSQGLFWNFY